MTKLSLTAAPNGSPAATVLTQSAAQPSAHAVNNQVFGDGLGSIDSVRQEIEDAFADAKTFFNEDPGNVIRLVMGHAARLSEIRGLIMRFEVMHRQWKPVRSEVENCLDELRQQYQYASRIISELELTWKIESGGRNG